MMEITGYQFHDAALQYYKLITTFPREQHSKFPPFRKYLSPANWSLFHDNVAGDAFLELSITGEKRFEALYSPHARTLLAMYVIQSEARRSGQNKNYLSQPGNSK